MPVARAWSGEAAVAAKDDHQRPPSRRLPRALAEAYAEMVVLPLGPTGGSTSWDDGSMRLRVVRPGGRATLGQRAPPCGPSC